MTLNPNVRNWSSIATGAVLLAALTASGFVAGSARSYTPPASGWLLVVTSDYRNQTGRILVVNPAAGTVTGEIAAGIEPDIVIARDGRRAYLSYNTGNGSVLAAIDLNTGTETARVADALPWPSHGQAYPPRITLSTDERRLFRYKVQNSESGTKYFLQTFDTERHQLLPQSMAIPQCGPAVFLGSPQQNTVYIACSQTQDVRVLTTSDTGEPMANRKPIYGQRSARAGDQRVAFLSPGGEDLTVIKKDGGFVRVDVASGQILRNGAVDAAARKVDPAAAPARSNAAPAPEDWLANRQVWSQTPTLSPDGTRLYVLTASGKDTRGVRDQIEVLSADSLERLYRIDLSRPCVSLALSVDGSELYAIDIQDSMVLVLDAATGREKRTISDVGPRPVYAVVVP